MPHPTLRTVAHAVPAAALLLATTACGTGTPDAKPASSPPQSAPRQSATGRPTTEPSEEDSTVHIRLTIDGHSVDATLNDSATARDFAGLLPLTLDLDDFQEIERVADLPRRPTTDGAPESSDPNAGDLAFYAPWGNLALFYRDGHPSPGLVILGHLTNRDDIARLANADRVRIQPAS
ncbi:cyclophilin-like fold protein [Streptomyces sp. NPDC058534]|uniref:cyclophilin-like fold protein n=1 Tax=Streptomyces sp. NPDC058534 TaxID=3346541 RepID=UPI0036476B8E